MTYVLPMAMDDLDTLQGFIVFAILMAMLFALMWKTNLYYQNPVLTILGTRFSRLSLKLRNWHNTKKRNVSGTTRGNVEEGDNIKRQIISDNVFIIYEDI